MSPGTLELQRILGTFVHSLFVSACTCLPLEMPLWVSQSFVIFPQSVFHRAARMLFKFTDQEYHFLAYTF